MCLHRNADRLADADKDVRPDFGGACGGDAEIDGEVDGMLVADPDAGLVVEPQRGGEADLGGGDVRALRDVDARRHARSARVAPIGLPAGLQVDRQHAVDDPVRIGRAAGDEAQPGAFGGEPGAGRGRCGGRGKRQEKEGGEREAHRRFLVHRSPLHKCDAPRWPIKAARAGAGRPLFHGRRSLGDGLQTAPETR